MKPLFNKIFLLLSLLGLVLISLPALAAETSPDAIAVRVMPNMDHLSPLTWYYNNVDIKGAPQALLVDGYEAVRDGRTVYINAGNIVFSPMGDTIYTNIYIISFNQEAESDTIDIFGQILQYWKFNAELVDKTGPGICQAKSNEPCDVAKGCTGKFMDQACEDDGTGAFSCVKKCLLSSECSYGQYCDSAKAKLVRDVKRMVDITDVQIVLETYKSKNKKYPSLPSGSYLPNKTISVWPSWNETLGRTLGIKLPQDPINKLQNCPVNSDSITCWDETVKKYAWDKATNSFVADFNNPVFPDGSFAYAYAWEPKSDIYVFCGNFETRYIGMPVNMICQARRPNEPQEGQVNIILGDLNSKEGAFRSYFAVNSKYPLDWKSLEVNSVPPNDWGNWKSRGWSWNDGTSRLISEDIPNFDNQKALVAKNVNLTGNKTYDFFDIEIKINDIYGKTGSAKGTIRICNPTTCQAQVPPAKCGRLADGCGGTLLCGDCSDTNKPDCVGNKCVKL